MKKYSTSVSTLIKRKDINELLNIVQADDSTKKRLLRLFGFDIDTVDLTKSEVTIKIATDESLVKLNPSITRSYYDEADILRQTVKKVPNNSELISFEGEIYEKLSFNSDEEAREFAKDHGYDMQLFGDTTALIHFRGLEWNQRTIDEVEEIKNLTKINGELTERYDDILKGSLRKALEEKEIYVVKTHNMYTIYYSQPLQYMNQTTNPGFSKEEIDSIEEVVEHLDKSYFVLYARDALEILKTNLQNRGYNPNKKFIGDKSMEAYINCITDNAANPNADVYVKIKVVSDTPVVVDDAVTQDVNIENVVGKMYKKIR